MLKSSIEFTAANCTASNPVVTLQHAKDFADGDSVVLIGAGAAHSLATPAAPVCDVMGEDGTTDYEHCLVALTKDWGWTLAGPAGATTNGPDALTDARWDGHNFVPMAAIRVVPQTPIPADVAMYAVYARSRPSGGAWSPWRICGGINANPSNVEPDPIPIRFLDFGLRPGVPSDTIPREGLPASAANDMLRTTIASGGGTTTVTLADAPQATLSGFAFRFDHCNAQALRDAIATGVVSIPEGNFRCWYTVLVEHRVTITGVNGEASMLQFAPGYGLQVEPAASGSVFLLFGVTTEKQTLPAGRYICPADTDDSNPDRRYHGAGIVIRANTCMCVGVRVVSMYGAGILVRGAAIEDSNANDNQFLVCRTSGNYGHGLVYHGSDAAAGSAFGHKAINNEGFGYLDASAYGNSTFGPHLEANHRGSYCVVNDTASALLAGAYSETLSAPSPLNRQAVTVGGTRGAQYTGEGMQLNAGGEFSPFVIEMGQGDPEQKRVAWGRNVEGGADPNLVMRLLQMALTSGWKPFNFEWRWLTSFKLAFSWIGALANRVAFEIVGPDTIWGGMLRLPELAIGSGSVRRRMGFNNVQPSAEGVYSPGSFWWNTTGATMGWRPTTHFGIGPARQNNETVGIGSVRTVGANAYVCKGFVNPSSGDLNKGKTAATAPTFVTNADVTDGEVIWTARPTGNVLSSTPAWATVPWPV